MRIIALLAILLLAAPSLQSQEQPEQRQRPQRQMRDGEQRQRPNMQRGQRSQRAGRGAMSERFTKFAEHDPKVGTEAPDFTLNLLDGKEVRLSEFRGTKNVMLVFGSYT